MVSSRVETKEQRKDTQDRIDEERRLTTEVRCGWDFSRMKLIFLYVIGMRSSDHEGSEVDEAQRPYK
jgi:hypothetical protein